MMRGSMSDKKKLVLLTGAAGRIGTTLRREWGGHYNLRLLDMRAIKDAPDSITADLRDFRALWQACRGVDTVVHLAAHPTEGDFHTQLLPHNLEGLYNMFEAAHQAQVRRFIFASTVQTIGGWGGKRLVTGRMVPRPISVYGATKIFGEALGRYYSDQRGMSVVCVRIGWFTDNDNFPKGFQKHRGFCIAVTGRDLAQLIRLAIDAPDLKYEILHGASDNDDCPMDWFYAQRLLGYQPQDGFREGKQSRKLAPGKDA